MKAALVWVLAVLVIVAGLWCEAWSADGAPVRITAEEVQRILRRAELDKQLRNNFVDCVLRCSGGLEAKRPDALTRGCRDKCVEDYLWQLRQVGEEGGGR